MTAGPQLSPMQGACMHACAHVRMDAVSSARSPGWRELEVAERLGLEYSCGEAGSAHGGCVAAHGIGVHAWCALCAPAVFVSFSVSSWRKGLT